MPPIGRNLITIDIIIIVIFIFVISQNVISLYSVVISPIINKTMYLPNHGSQGKIREHCVT